MSSLKWPPFCLGLNVLTHEPWDVAYIWIYSFEMRTQCYYFQMTGTGPVWKQGNIGSGNDNDKALPESITSP